ALNKQITFLCAQKSFLSPSTECLTSHEIPVGLLFILIIASHASMCFENIYLHTLKFFSLGSLYTFVLLSYRRTSPVFPLFKGIKISAIPICRALYLIMLCASRYSQVLATVHLIIQFTQI